MATTQCQREKTGTWSTIFPNDTVSEQQSALFVKKLLAVAISNISYLRAIFPEHAFGDRCLEDLNLKILRDDSTCPGACHVIKWVKGCFDALDKKYLKVLMIGLYTDPEEPDTVIESYTFKFSYTKEGGIDIYRNEKKISSAYTATETKKATIRLLRTIVVLTQTLQSLPDEVMMTMKLLYYEDVTPPDYEPPGFKAANSDSFVFDVDPMNINVGDVSTSGKSCFNVVNCHGLSDRIIKVRLKTDKQQFEMKEEPIQGEEEEQNEEMDIEQKEEISQQQCMQSTEDATVPTECPALPGEEDNQESEGQEEFGVRCPCGCNEDDGLMILCAECKFWQHGICFLVRSEDDAPSHHICDVCAQLGVEGKIPTDPYLCGLSAVAVQATCIWRRALMATTEMKRILAPNLSKRLGVEMNVAQGLVNRLEKENYISTAGKGKRLGKIVNQEKIMQEGFPKYLTKIQPGVQKGNQASEVQEDSTMDDSSRPSDHENDAQMDKLTDMAGKIELQKKGKKKGRKPQKKAKIEEPPQSSQQVEIRFENTEVPTKKMGRKRAISKVDGAVEFEVSESQDVTYDSQDLTSSEKRRKKKASVVARAIMV